MDGCRIDTTYVKRDESKVRYKDSFNLNLYEEFKQDGPNTWKGTWGPYIITAIQRHRHHDIKEEDIDLDKNPSHKEDSHTIYAPPSKTDIAEALNKHLQDLRLNINT